MNTTTISGRFYSTLWCLGQCFLPDRQQLLAALSIQLGLEPLLEVANREMMRWRDRWSDLDIPETWNASCIGLLLDADDAYRKREGEEQGTQVSINPHCEDEPPAKRVCLENLSVTFPL
ncbi:hypothetical protein VC83_08412 [Pseudogymnoascus destructans]|uniref:Uncharacterized protein n=1 Tax=Pseudogymnoascus destructans TaxID=655981 RepID=A0A177A2N4_9PEZI|nr:uncharacterized protein VC83_08412 [Pseudogymnoascus destructans]OAF55194.1 hypothetical protein VC83_08412 [Pseudogymnoascus destructans]